MDIRVEKQTKEDWITFQLKCKDYNNEYKDFQKNIF